MCTHTLSGDVDGACSCITSGFCLTASGDVHVIVSQHGLQNQF